MPQPTRLDQLRSLFANHTRVGITGAPGTGKSTLAAEAIDAGLLTEAEVFACDVGLKTDGGEKRNHSELVDWVVDDVPPTGRVLVEGCAVPWAIRAGVKLDAVLVLTEQHEELAGNQKALAAGIETVLAELVADGAAVIREETPIVSKSITLSCMGEIGYQVQANDFLVALTEDVTDVTVLINSPGGDAFEGFAIANLLKQHPASVTVNIVGLCASAATFIAMAADKIRIAANGVMMIHEASGGAYGRADALDAQADALRKVNDAMIGVYASRTGRSEASIREMLSKGDNYLTATEAKAQGFVDEIIPDKVPEANLRALKTAQLKGAPAAFIAAIHAALAPVHTDNAPPKDLISMDVEKLIADLATMTPDQRTALVKHAESNAKLKDLFATPELVEASALAGKFTALVGKTGDAAIGAVAALQASQAETTSLKATVDELLADKADREVGDLLKANANKVPPAMRDGILAKYKAKVLNAAAITAMLEVLPVIPGTVAVKQPVAQAPGEKLKHDGKTFAELKPSEKVALKAADPDMFNAMLAQG